MPYIVGKISESSFQQNWPCIFSIFLEGARSKLLYKGRTVKTLQKMLIEKFTIFFGFDLENVPYMDGKVFKSIFCKNWPCIDSTFVENMRAKISKSVRKRSYRQPLPIPPIAPPKPISFNLGPILAQLYPLSTSIFWSKPKLNVMAHFLSFFPFFSSSLIAIPCCQPMLLLLIWLNSSWPFKSPCTASS